MTDAPPTRRLLVEWRNRVQAEYTSAALTAQTLHWLIQAGFPRDLIDTCQRIVRDELDHAELSHDTLVALGGEDLPVGLDVTRLQMPMAAEGPLASLLDSIVRNFCLGETFAVPLFAAMRETTTHPAVEPMLTRVLKDESVHRQFGWDALDALLERDPAGVRARTELGLPQWLAGYHRAYGDPPQGPPLQPIELAAGMMEPARYAEVHDRTLRDTIAPRFAKRGITCPIGSDV